MTGEIRSIRSIENHGDVNVLPLANYVDARSLAKNVAETITIPTGARYVLFSSTANFYAKVDGVAAVATDTSNGSSSELNPTLRRLVKDQGSIGLIAPTAAVITLAWYA